MKIICVPLKYKLERLLNANEQMYEEQLKHTHIVFTVFFVSINWIQLRQ